MKNIQPNLAERLKMKFRTLPLKKKLIALIAAVSTLVVSLSMAASFIIELNLFRDQLMREYQTTARMIATNIEAAVVFEEERDAKEILGTLVERQSVVTAAVYLDNGYALSIYRRPGVSLAEQAPEPNSETNLSGNTLTVNVEVREGDQTIGHVTMLAQLKEIESFVFARGFALFAIFAFSTAIAIYLAARIGKMISSPILDLAKTAERISVEQDFSVRHERTTEDETGKLVDSFNKMITEIESREGKIIEAKESAEASSKAKDNFLSVISHELRTPLNPIIGYVDILCNKEFGQEEKKQLGLIKQYAEHLQGLIDDTIDFSRIERGVFSIEAKPVDYKNLCHGVVNLLAEAAAAKGLKISCSHKFDPAYSEQEIFIATDHLRFRQILLNLLANSIKFTFEGEIAVATLLFNNVENQPTLRVEVNDKGIGISEKDREKVFEPFAQVEESLTRQHDGMGLGLAITRKIVTAMNGTINFTSVVGTGTSFWFEIPVDIVAAPKTEKPTAPDLYSKIKGRVLLVDDQLVNRELGETLIAERGLEVVCASSGFEAVEIAKKEQFNLVIMDIKMPRMDGYDTARELRKLDTVSRDTPIIAMTAHVTANGSKNCFEAGMDGFIAKPFNSQKLDTILSKWVSKEKS